MDDYQRHVHFYSQHRHSVCVCVIYLRPAIGECVIHSPCPLFSFLLQELIEVDSDVVFELASYILQVR